MLVIQKNELLVEKNLELGNLRKELDKQKEIVQALMVSWDEVLDKSKEWRDTSGWGSPEKKGVEAMYSKIHRETVARIRS